MKKIISSILIIGIIFSLCAFAITASATSRPVGDLDNTGSVALDDALKLFKVVAGVATITDSEREFADVNGDGTVNLDDALKLFKIVAGVDSEAPEVTVEADSVRFYMCSEDYEYFIIERDETFGAIDENGNIIIDIEYTYLSLRETPDGFAQIIADDPEENLVQFNKDGTVEETWGGGWGGGCYALPYYNVETNSVVMVYYDGIVETEQVCDFDKQLFNNLNFPIVKNDYYANVADPFIFIRQISGLESNPGDWGEWVSYEPIYAGNKYAIFNASTGELVTDFVFDEYHEFADGVAIVKQNGNWRYVNTEGEFITDKCYPCIMGYESITDFYYPSNGYIIVLSENGYGLIDTDGNVILDFEYEDMSQVNPNGYLWIKDGSTWTRVSVN